MKKIIIHIFTNLVLTNNPKRRLEKDEAVY
jgi:hypothetical protein